MGKKAAPRAKKRGCENWKKARKKGYSWGDKNFRPRKVEKGHTAPCHILNRFTQPKSTKSRKPTPGGIGHKWVVHQEPEAIDSTWERELKKGKKKGPKPKTNQGGREGVFIKGSQCKGLEKK